MRTKSQILALALLPSLLLLSLHSPAQSVTMPRMREMATMQDHEHPQSWQAAPGFALEQSSTPTFTFAAVDVPGATGTLATGINANGHVVGIYYDSAGNSHGFLLKRNQFFTVDVPGSLVGVSGTLQTEVNGINNAGDIVGDYYAPPGGTRRTRLHRQHSGVLTAMPPWLPLPERPVLRCAGSGQGRLDSEFHHARREDLRLRSRR
jgi:probable HAF family extracellular repeat protein